MLPLFLLPLKGVSLGIQKPVWPAVVPTPLILFCARMLYVTFISAPT